MAVSKARLLHDSLELVLLRDDAFPARFYDVLFESQPALRGMFYRHTPDELRRMFVEKLTALVDHVEDPAWLGRELISLADNHAAYGVTAEMYPWVGDALLRSLSEVCGEAWTPEVDQAWREVYGVISSAMIAASP